MRNLSHSVVLSAVVILTGSSALIAESEANERAIRRSDVVFMYDNPKVYEAYGCTALGWAGRQEAEHISKAHAAGVKRFSCSVGFLTEFRRVIDFDPDYLDAACRNFNGEPYTVPWLWDHKHKGEPAYWWCTNSPLYRKYLFSRLEQVIKAGPDGLHVDDYRGTSGSVTWRAGGFCKHCMAAFRKYLAANVSADRLAELGIKDLATFDYRRFLIDRGVKAEDYDRTRAGLPLMAEFHRFHVKAATDFVAEYHRRACKLAGRPITLSVNSGLSDPQALAIAPHLSYFCCEVHHGASKRRPATHPVYVYKLADGLGRPVCSTASGQDWAFIMAHNLPGLVRTWTALSYAFGHTLMAPHRQWCYTKEKGTHWYSGPTEEYDWLHRFVRSQARLLDGYEAVAPVVVVYSNAADRRKRGQVEPICVDLADANVPFRVVLAGDDWLPDYRLAAADLAKAKAVVVPKQLDLDDAQQKIIDRAKADGRLVTWPDREGLARLLPDPVAIDGATNVWAVSRAVPGDPDRPAVVHLLNRNYDAKTDTMVPQRQFRLRIRRDLFSGREFAAAVAHAPKARPTKLAISSNADHVIVTVGELGLWAILELK